MWIVAGLIYVLLPASDRAEGERFLKRVTEHASWIVTSEDVRLAAFPEDGLTSEALLKALTQPAEQELAWQVSGSVRLGTGRADGQPRQLHEASDTGLGSTT